MLCCNSGTLTLDVMINGLVSSRAVLDFFLQPCCSSSLMWIWDSGYVLCCFYSGFYNFGVGSEHFAYVRWWLCLWRAWKWVTRWLIWQPKLKNSPWPVSEIIKCLPFHQGVLEQPVYVSLPNNWCLLWTSQSKVCTTPHLLERCPCWLQFRLLLLLS